VLSARPNPPKRFYLKHFGKTRFQVEFLSIAVDVIVIMFMFFVGKDILGKKEGYLASMFYAFNHFTLLFSSGMAASPICFLVGRWIGDIHTLTYFGIFFFFTLVLFIDWIRTLRSENRLQPSMLLKRSPFNKFLKIGVSSDSSNKAKTKTKQKNNG
jgi:hypothetical protein